MLVSTGDKAHLRGMKKATASRNGSFVSIRFEKEGLNDTILIERGSLERALERLKEHGDEAEILVDMDQAIDIKTLVAEFVIRKNWLDGFLSRWGQEG